MSGGVPPWSWPALGPMVRDLDALYINFISGYEMTLESARFLRRGLHNFLYAALPSLLFGMEPDGTRVLRPACGTIFSDNEAGCDPPRGIAGSVRRPVVRSVRCRVRRGKPKRGEASVRRSRGGVGIALRPRRSPRRGSGRRAPGHGAHGQA